MVDMALILGIDPGTSLSAYCVMDSEDMSRIIDKGKTDNDTLKALVKQGYYDVLVIEGFQSFGMAVGATVFTTAYYIGRLLQMAEDLGSKTHIMYRTDVKMHICGTTRAKDANIRCALIDRFAVHDKARGTGTIKAKDFFYGVSADIWSAVGICVTYIDTIKQQSCNQPVTKEIHNGDR